MGELACNYRRSDVFVFDTWRARRTAQDPRESPPLPVVISAPARGQGRPPDASPPGAALVCRAHRQTGKVACDKAATILKVRRPLCTAPPLAAPRRPPPAPHRAPASKPAPLPAAPPRALAGAAERQHVPEDGVPVRRRAGLLRHGLRQRAAGRLGREGRAGGAPQPRRRAGAPAALWSRVTRNRLAGSRDSVLSPFTPLPLALLTGSVLRLVPSLLREPAQIVNVACPHPFLPILAVSGIDDDIKIFHPCALPSLDSLAPVVSQPRLDPLRVQPHPRGA